LYCSQLNRRRRRQTVIAFAVESDFDVQAIRSNTFEIEWPPKGGKMQSFPEIDRAQWFDLASAHLRILDGRRPLLARRVLTLGQLKWITLGPLAAAADALDLLIDLGVFGSNFRITRQFRTLRYRAIDPTCAIAGRSRGG
jgi:hypothetical protein